MLKRSIFLFFVGLVYLPLWPADILHYYGVYIAIGVLFLFVKPRYFWIAMAVAVIGFHVMLFTLNYNAGWDWEVLEYPEFWPADGFLRNMFFNGFHPVFPWISFLFFGMWIGRQNLTEPKARRKLLKLGIAVFVVSQSISFLLLPDGLSDNMLFLVGTGPMPPVLFYPIVAGSLALVILILCMEFTEKWKNTVLERWMVPLGQLALSHYFGHVVIGMGLLVIMEMLHEQDLAFSIMFTTGYAIFATVSSYLWKKRFKRGPLETVMRKFSS